MNFVNGDIFDGEFENDMRQGLGKFVQKDQDGNIVKTYEGLYENNEPSNTSIANPALID